MRVEATLTDHDDITISIACHGPRGVSSATQLIEWMDANEAYFLDDHEGVGIITFPKQMRSFIFTKVTP
jgi:hypothetical protein